ncbi:MFS transporter [Solwaraspora sp. WMMD406]|uniref:MFS transporter n=1 Tax=Solwaraspora sp. WMMD406 TaxID=3016095 RepID=UPI002416DD8E|nr:MFS transporter [Solwaraspora sp. WMMD406]MDG4766937.1 MFS transporter [Solwaraspora sp. WMMD406]
MDILDVWLISGEAAFVKMRLGLLRQFDYRQLWMADVISQLGVQVSSLALPLVAVLSLEASRFEVGLLAAFETAAFLLIGLPAGAWVDRLRRRRVLVAADLGRAVILASVPLAWWTGLLTMPQLYVVALLAGGLTVFFDVAHQTYLPYLVGADHLLEGNAKLEGARGVNQIAGPTVAGLLVQWITAPFAVVVNVVGYLASAFVVTRIRQVEQQPAPAPDANLRREIMEGLRFVLRSRLLRPIAACSGAANFLAAMTNAMLIVLLARDLGLSAGTIGVFFSLCSAGALVGALAAQRVADRLGHGRTIWIAMAASSPFELLIPLAQRGWLLWLAATGAAIAWFGSVIYNITQLSFRQRLTPDRLLGRVNASMRFLVWGTMPLGALAGGVLGQYLGARTTLVVAAICQTLVFLPTFLSPLRTMRELPTVDDPQRPAKQAAQV